MFNVLEMKTTLLILLTAATLTVRAADESLSQSLQKGLFEEEANHDLATAIDLYKNITSRFDEERKITATALFRLGECYRKLGKLNEAQQYYSRILMEFSDQAELVKQARTMVKSGMPNPEQARVQEMFAAKSNEAEIQQLETLLRNSPDLLNAPTSAGDGKTHLQQAAANGKLNLVQFLIEKHAPLETPWRGPGGNWDTALHLAVGNGHRAVVEALLNAGAKINAKTSDGSAPLHLAATKGFREIAALLLEKGADVNARNRNGETPLHRVSGENVDLAAMLLAKGADVNARDRENETPLKVAIASGSAELVDLLLSKGANPNILSADQTSNLFWAARGSNPDIVQKLVKAGADLNAQDRTGVTPLHMAVISRNLDTVKVLVENGADVNAKTFSGESPLLLGIRQDAYDICEYLLSKSANPNAPDQDGNPPLRSAFIDWRLVELLIAEGANVNSTKNGATLLDLAINPSMNNNQRPGPKVIEILKAHGATNAFSNPPVRTVGTQVPSANTVPLAPSNQAGKKD